MFKTAKVVVSLALMATAVGVVPAQATHCANKVILFTGSVRMLNLGEVGCLVDEVVGLHGVVDTFYITPGATRAFARFVDPVDPGGFSLSSFGVVILDCDLATAGTQAPPCTLTTVPGPDLSVPPDGIPDYYDSAEARLDPLTTTTGGGAMTLSAGGYTGTWRTVA
jgi:hypothetical protein